MVSLTFHMSVRGLRQGDGEAGGTNTGSGGVVTVPSPMWHHKWLVSQTVCSGRLCGGYILYNSASKRSNRLAFSHFSINLGADSGGWNKLWITFFFFFLVIGNFVLFGTVKGAANSSGGCTSGQQQKMKRDKHLRCIAPSHLSRVLQTQQVDKSCFTMCFLFRVLICRAAWFLLFFFCLPCGFSYFCRVWKKQQFILLFMLPCLSDPFLWRANRLYAAVKCERPVSLILLLRATLPALPFTAVKN